MGRMKESLSVVCLCAEWRRKESEQEQNGTRTRRGREIRKKKGPEWENTWIVGSDMLCFNKQSLPVSSRPTHSKVHEIESVKKRNRSTSGVETGRNMFEQREA